MDPIESGADKITPERRSYSGATLVAWLIIALQILVSLITYPFLPDQVPSHWNAAGEINGYLPKAVNAILVPALSIGIYILLQVLMRASPRLGQSRQSQRATWDVVNLIIAGVLLFLLITQLATTAIALGMTVDIAFVISLGLSVLLIFLGNYMGKLRRNFWAGIRTPWTLTNAVVWERTHRLGGWLFVAVGLIGIVCSFVPALRLWGILVPVIAVSLFLCVYSYVCYRQQTM